MTGLGRLTPSAYGRPHFLQQGLQFLGLPKALLHANHCSYEMPTDHSLNPLLRNIEGVTRVVPRALRESEQWRILTRASWALLKTIPRNFALVSRGSCAQDKTRPRSLFLNCRAFDPQAFSSSIGAPAPARKRVAGL
jgi:hypothetical protein